MDVVSKWRWIGYSDGESLTRCRPDLILYLLLKQWTEGNESRKRTLELKGGVTKKAFDIRVQKKRMGSCVRTMISLE